MTFKTALTQELIRLKNIGTSATLIAVMAFTINVATLPVFAQATENATINQQEGLDTTTGATTDDGTTQNRANNDFNWLWLLPLLAIPLLFMLMRRKPEHDETEYRREYQDRDYISDRTVAGAKGGEVNHRGHDHDFDDIDDRNRTGIKGGEVVRQRDRDILENDAVRREDEVEHFEVDPWDRSQDR